MQLLWRPLNWHRGTEPSGSDRKAFCFSWCHSATLLPCALPCFNTLSILPRSGVLCIDLPSQRLPPPHCTLLHFIELRIARRRCRVSGRHCCLPRLLPLSPSGGRLFPWPSRSQPHSGVKFLLKHLFNFTAACRTGDLQLTSRSWKRVWCLQPYGYGCQKMAAKVNCLIRCTFKMTWWWHYRSDKNDNDFIL